jgi:hypothetical protein
VESWANGFGAYEAWTNEPYYGSRDTVFADVDGDGKVDAIVVNDNWITVRRSTGSRFGAYEAWTNEPYYGNIGTVFADVDDNGRADAIVVNDWAITVRRAIPVPKAPSGLNFSNETSTTIRLSWGDNASNEQLFEIYVDSRRQDTVPANTRTATVRYLLPGTRYCFYVTAWNTSGASSPSNTVCASTTSAPPTQPPSATGSIYARLDVDAGFTAPRTCGVVTFNLSGTSKSVSSTGSSYLTSSPTGWPLYKCKYEANFFAVDPGTYRVVVQDFMSCKPVSVSSGASRSVILDPYRCQ